MGLSEDLVSEVGKIFQDKWESGMGRLCRSRKP